MSHSTVSAQDLISSGSHVICTKCGGLIRPTNTACPFCQHPLSQAVPSRPGRSRRDGTKRGDLGGLATLPENELVLVVFGKPESQGSMNAVAPGVAAHHNAKELKQWRRAITKASKDQVGDDWVPVNAAVHIAATFTVPLPKSAPTGSAVAADGYRDLDKLQRAIGDALCPTTGFRVLASDMRITAWFPWKTHPRPLHDHPDALHEPGIVIRVRPHQAAPGLEAPAPSPHTGAQS